ncbi:MAG: hypothetical protein E6Q98_01040 [Rhodospirillaceae bacterium]|nr:MAG: hypothetical protein E6Q98_01040 [Rhodospirillaceae bacterium]
MAADDRRRETMLRNMKFERLAPSLLYRSLNNAVTKFLTSPTRDKSILAKCRAYLQAEIEASINPQQRENLTYETRALDAFENSLNALPMAGANFEHAPQATAPITYSQVHISVWPMARVRVIRPRGATLIGALIVDLAKGITPRTEAAKERLTDEMTFSAVLLHEFAATNLVNDGEKSSPEHCWIFHSHRQQLLAAPNAYKKILANIEAACQHISRGWDDIKPPETFDAKFASYRS